MNWETVLVIYYKQTEVMRIVNVHPTKKSAWTKTNQTNH